MGYLVLTCFCCRLSLSSSSFWGVVLSSSAVKESKHKYYMAGWLEDIATLPKPRFEVMVVPSSLWKRADRLLHDYLNARRKHFRIVMRQVLFALGLQAVASTVLLGLGGWLVVSGELTLGQLVAGGTNRDRDCRIFCEVR